MTHEQDMKELRRYWVAEDRRLMRYDEEAVGEPDNAHYNLWAQVELLQGQLDEQAQELDRLRADCAEMCVRDVHWCNFLRFLTDNWSAMKRLVDAAKGDRAPVEQAERQVLIIEEALRIEKDRIANRPTGRSSGQPLLDRAAKLETALRGLRDEIREYNPTDIDLTGADAALAGVAELEKEQVDG